MHASKDSKMGTGRTRLKVKDFNELITCSLCGGYKINPIALDNCSHSYCRICIIKHLEIDSYCPQCKHNGGKQITYSNLRSDEVLRRVIFKLVPGLYEKERDRIAQFSRASGLDDDAAHVFETDDQIVSPKEPISLSMEYHPAALRHCSTEQIPPICYLQCQAGVKIYHLKRLMCSKFGISPTDQRVELDVIYEDEVLPTDFSLMDVAYCYNWTRNAPMTFRYRVVLLNSKPQNSQTAPQAQDAGIKTVEAAKFKAPLNSIKKSNNDAKSLSFTISSVGHALPRTDKTLKAKQPAAESSTEQSNNSLGKAAPKSPESKKLSPPRANQETPIITNNFKSLRSNDMRGSDYNTVTSTTVSTKPKTVEPPEPVPKSVMKISGTTLEVAPKLVVKKEIDFMVKIPKTEAPLVDAGTEYYIAKSKKSPHAHEANNNTKKCRDLPKLKIDLNNLTTKCALVKPKSADVHSEKSELKRLKYRKHSLDESEVLADKVDLETYAKNIGLKPIEIATPEHKYSPNASPRSSNSSSASSISAGTVFLASTEDLTSTSSHKKRKKKHSKSNGKRRKLHAEISSQPEEESLKMKVKITGSHIHTHKTHKSDSKRDAAGSTQKSPKCSSAEREDGMPIIKIKTKYASLPSTPLHDNGELPNLNKKLSKSTSNDIEVSSVGKHRESRGLESSIAAQIASKFTANSKELKTPVSPTLPPSLFKATAFTPTPTSVNEPKSSPNKVKPIAPKVEPLQQTFKLHTPEAKIKPPPVKMPQPEFLVPVNPRQLFAAQRSPSTPSTIATALQKSATLLKRSASMDDDALAVRLGVKQRRLEPHGAMRKTAYHPSMDSPHMLSMKYKQQNGKLTPAVRPNPMDRVYCPPIPAPSSALLKKSKPTTSISISKVSDTFSKSPLSSGTSAVTITARPKSVVAQQAQLGYNAPDLAGKPAVEIVRINSHQTPVDKKPLPLPSRVMGPPLTSAKIKKPAVQQMKISPGSTVKSPPLIRNPPHFPQKPHNSYRTSPPALINFRNTVPLPFATKSSADAAAKAAKPSAAESQKASLRDFRPAFKEPGGDILDLSAEKAEKPLKSPKVPTLSAGSSLEDALNKIKQNISALDNSTGTAAKYESSHAETTSDDLQNLHMLSESATAREKIAIQAPLNEKPKIPQTMLVRQQNASVRNIPNPSALAFRNQPSSINLPLSPTKSPGDGDKLTNAKSAAAPHPATAPAAPANRPAKKHPTIDQVAANLNMRAAAAEASAVKSAVSEEVAVSSTSLAEKPIADTNKKAASADSISGSNKNVAATSSGGKIAEKPVNVKTSEPSSEAKKSLSLTSAPNAVNAASTVST